MGWSQDLFRALWRSLSREVKEHVGTDQFGNKYYCIPQYKNWRGQTIREKRIVEGANKKEVDYEIGDIPTEWEDSQLHLLNVYSLLGFDRIPSLGHNRNSKRLD
ncbi:NADH dehydrogenase [ubiquinone] 1 alpha subcomplex assembly factor 2 isoform X4 [Macaca fascicularis]|uniref:NADH dehydrogenase [ubiquinone] 1 alpha subcomplex assembly factor 2 isoform X4 n=1 Tax=Macaca fascicularis TaxID=9541 RepID=UPI003D15D9F7